MISEEEKVTRLVPSDCTYDRFFEKFMLSNQPCIFLSCLTENWKARLNWVDSSGRPDLSYLLKEFGKADVPVADCGTQQYGSHCKETKQFSKFIDYWREHRALGYPADGKCLYLKDWHFTKAFPNYNAYTTPVYFKSDWMNEFWDAREDSDDDYRFVYMGPKGSWTSLHADVFRSYSWSANICGRKKWIFIPPGQEEMLKDIYGNLVYDVNSKELENRNVYPKYCPELCQRLEVIQAPGEVIFVPTGWHHQVHNLEDTISINHNWMNGCSAATCWQFLQQNLEDVKRAIDDCRSMEGWRQQCQLVLKASSGIDYSDFWKYLQTIANNRSQFLDRISNVGQGHTSEVKVQKDQDRGAKFIVQKDQGHRQKVMVQQEQGYRSEVKVQQEQLYCTEKQNTQIDDQDELGLKEACSSREVSPFPKNVKQAKLESDDTGLLEQVEDAVKSEIIDTLDSVCLGNSQSCPGKFPTDDIMVSKTRAVTLAGKCDCDLSAAVTEFLNPRDLCKKQCDWFVKKRLLPPDLNLDQTDLEKLPVEEIVAQRHHALFDLIQIGKVLEMMQGCDDFVDMLCDQSEDK